ncbi:hypothetical protein [Pseudonocardia sp.]|uniref:hypothetical protein n=1 Tax=Pseudonocardia sp. TaxID=60912 RepID=UPI003D12B064
MRVEFRKRPGGGTLATVDRPDGVQLLLTSYDRASAVPHDLAHFVTERALGLERGLWGSIAAGAEFGSLTVLAGRRRHDAAARSQAIRHEHAADLGLAEILVGAVQHGVASGDAAGHVRRAWASVRETPCPFPASRCDRAADELRRLSAELARTGQLSLEWPAGGRGSGGGRPHGTGRRRSR